VKLTNGSDTMPINGLAILGAAPTKGVVLTSPTPVTVGDLPAGSSGNALLRFNVPPGVGSFQTTIYAGCSDGCGGSYYFPGPPPGP